MAFVEVKQNESLDEALKRFRKLNEREGINPEIKKRSFYEKPAAARKRIKEVRRRKLLKKMRRMQSRSY